MGLFNVRSSINPNKLAALVLIEPGDKPLVINRTAYNPGAAQLYSSSGLNETRLFHLEKGIIGKETDIPSATLGRVYLAEEGCRHLFPTVVVLVPLDTKGQTYAKAEVEIEDFQVSSDTEKFCVAAVAQAVTVVADRKLSELELVNQEPSIGVPTT